GIISESCFLRDPYDACSNGDSSWVTIGDSYAGTLDFYLSKVLLEKGHGLMSLTYEQCPFVNDFWFGNVPECVEVNKRRWNIIKSFKERISLSQQIIISSGRVSLQQTILWKTVGII
ncbi:SGNH hydrolase domain-containing protein, partial [Enterobacter hormaechei]